MAAKASARVHCDCRRVDYSDNLQEMIRSAVCRPHRTRPAIELRWSAERSFGAGEPSAWMGRHFRPMLLFPSKVRDGSQCDPKFAGVSSRFGRTPREIHDKVSRPRDRQHQSSHAARAVSIPRLAAGAPASSVSAHLGSITFCSRPPFMGSIAFAEVQRAATDHDRYESISGSRYLGCSGRRARWDGSDHARRTTVEPLAAAVRIGYGDPYRPLAVAVASLSSSCRSAWFLRAKQNTAIGSKEQ